MRSIYEQALGKDFEKLHPRIRERFGFSSGDRVASIGEGRMDKIWYSKWAAAPLRLGASRRIMFPQGGRSIPFTIENYAYTDDFGRETVTWNRTFAFPRKMRHFDATMIYSEQRGGIVDYLGTKQHLAVDLSVSVQPNGGIRIVSGEQRFYEGRLAFRFPQPFTGVADVREWYDDERQRFRISVKVTNAIIGNVFQYEGSFAVRFVDTRQAAIPEGARPIREERRE